MKAVCSEYKIHNADVHLKEDCDVDDLVDVIEGSRVYIPCIYVLNKIDQVKPCFLSLTCIVWLPACMSMHHAPSSTPTSVSCQHWTHVKCVTTSVSGFTLAPASTLMFDCALTCIHLSV